MTDPASPAAVTEERIATLLEWLPSQIKRHRHVGAVTMTIDLLSVERLLAALDARGLELARVREELHDTQTAYIEKCGDSAVASIAANARLAQANEALTDDEMTTACRELRKALPGINWVKGEVHQFWMILTSIRGLSTPPAQSAGEALDPAGTGEGVEEDLSRVESYCGSVYPAWGPSWETTLAIRRLAALIRAQASALAEARKDAERLDWLDTVNKNANVRNGTRYGWKFDINHNRAALTDHNIPALTVRQAIDEARPQKPLLNLQDDPARDV